MSTQKKPVDFILIECLPGLISTYRKIGFCVISYDKLSYKTDGTRFYMVASPHVNAIQGTGWLKKAMLLWMAKKLIRKKSNDTSHAIAHYFASLPPQTLRKVDIQAIQQHCENFGVDFIEDVIDNAGVLFNVAENKLLFTQGLVDFEVMFLLTGKVGFFKEGDIRKNNQSTEPFKTCTPGRFFGEMSMLSGGGSRCASVKTLEPCTIVTIQKSKINQLLKKVSTMPCGQVFIHIVMQYINVLKEEERAI